MPEPTNAELSAHLVEVDARQTMFAERITRVETTTESRIDKLEAKIDDLKVEITRITRPTLLSPQVLGMFVAVALGLSGLITGLARGDSPHEAVKAATETVQSADPLMQMLLDRAFPPKEDEPKPETGRP
jgi:hypothetical protein